MKGIVFIVIMPVLIYAAGCSGYHPVPAAQDMDLYFQDSSYINHGVVVNYLCGEVGVYRCPHITPKHPADIAPALPDQAVKIKPDKVLNTIDHVYYFPSGSWLIRHGYSLGADKNLEIDSIVSSTDTKGKYLSNLVLAKNRINAAIQLIGSVYPKNNIKNIMHVKCCFGNPGVSSPLWRDRYVMIRFKPKTEKGGRL